MQMDPRTPCIPAPTPAPAPTRPFWSLSGTEMFFWISDWLAEKRHKVLLYPMEGRDLSTEFLNPVAVLESMLTSIKRGIMGLGMHLGILVPAIISDVVHLPVDPGFRALSLVKLIPVAIYHLVKDIVMVILPPFVLVLVLIMGLGMLATTCTRALFRGILSFPGHIVSFFESLR